MTKLSLEAIEKQASLYNQYGGEDITLEQSFNKFLRPILPKPLADSEGNYEDWYKELSIGNMVLEKSLRTLEEKNITLLHKWHRYNSLRNGITIDESKYRNDSVKSSVDDNEEKSLNGVEIPTKSYPKNSKNDGKILTPMAPGDRKKRHRRPASQIERHYKCPIDKCRK